MLMTGNKFSRRAIMAMSPQTRERFYRQEKDALFMKIAHMSAEEVQREHKRLADKWRV